jgi:hypothetical protein
MRRVGAGQVLAAGLDAPGMEEQLHAEALRAAGLLTVVRALGSQPGRCEHGIGEGRAAVIIKSITSHQSVTETCQERWKLLCNVRHSSGSGLGRTSGASTCRVAPLLNALCWLPQC